MLMFFLLGFLTCTYKLLDIFGSIKNPYCFYFDYTHGGPQHSGLCKVKQDWDDFCLSVGMDGTAYNDKLWKVMKVCSVTSFTGRSVHIIESVSDKKQRRGDLQDCLEDLVLYGAEEGDLDKVLLDNVSKNMRV